MTPVEPRFFTTSILAVRERLLLRGGRWRKVPLRVRVGYFHHPRLGHTLIDTGYSAGLTRPGAGHSLLLALYRRIIRPSTYREYANVITSTGNKLAVPFSSGIFFGGNHRSH